MKYQEREEREKCAFLPRGGGRVAIFVLSRFIPGMIYRFFLLNVFAKGDKVNLTMAERNGLKKILGGVAKAYRERKQKQ